MRKFQAGQLRYLLVLGPERVAYSLPIPKETRKLLSVRNGNRSIVSGPERRRRDEEYQPHRSRYWFSEIVQAGYHGQDDCDENYSHRGCPKLDAKSFCPLALREGEVELSQQDRFQGVCPNCGAARSQAGR